MAEPSILKSVKKWVGVDPSYDVFDEDIITHVNSTFMLLNQLGVGPSTGFMIEDEEDTWGMYMVPDDDLAAVKSYMMVKVRMFFDPPTNASLFNSLMEMAKELEWRLNVHADRPST